MHKIFTHTLYLAILAYTHLTAEIYPINFSIPACKIVATIPKKDCDFAPLVPGVMSTYIYDDEQAYYKDYQRSYYAITSKKAGWDCMRHYEILANGCIPYFIDLESCDDHTMYFLPRELILEAMHVKGVRFMGIDHAQFDKVKYYEILNKLLEHTRKHLTTEAMAGYLLRKIQYSGQGNILFLSSDTYTDYMRCLTLIGLKQLYGHKVVDYPKIPHIYTTYKGNIKELYGKGMSYTKILPDPGVNRENIENRIRNKEFDLIIYGSVHRGMPYLDLVQKTYDPKHIAYICGEDWHKCEHSTLNNLFLREFEAIK
ncbi:MAG: hypothetical protein LLF94_03680 [Chlamydiales bacterium]|nr:hypothetical protein [Chlamydiales bacterium]